MRRLDHARAKFVTEKTIGPEDTFLYPGYVLIDASGWVVDVDRERGTYRLAVVGGAQYDLARDVLAARLEQESVPTPYERTARAKALLAEAKKVYLDDYLDPKKDAGESVLAFMQGLSRQDREVVMAYVLEGH